jgi:hypothetical protein
MSDTFINRSLTSLLKTMHNDPEVISETLEGAITLPGPEFMSLKDEHSRESQGSLRETEAFCLAQSQVSDSHFWAVLPDCPTCGASGLNYDLGCHSRRHSHKLWLGSCGANSTGVYSVYLWSDVYLHLDFKGYL